MPAVKIFKKARSATQSGYKKTRRWVVQFQYDERITLDPVMGWHSSRDVNQQLTLTFSTLEKAVAYVESKGYYYVVDVSHDTTLRPKHYGENFTLENMRNL